MKVLVTGGLGYIGSHTCVELLEGGYDVVVLDNLSNSKEEVKDKIKEITGKDIKFYLGDMIDENLLDNIFTEEKICNVKGINGIGILINAPTAVNAANNVINTISFSSF